MASQPHAGKVQSKFVTLALQVSPYAFAGKRDDDAPFAILSATEVDVSDFNAVR